MTIEEFYAHQGPFMAAFQPLADRLTDQASRWWNQGTSWEDRLTPWVAHLGKGGLRHDREKGTVGYYPEVSLYRHIMDVSVIASFLFYWAWQSGHVTVDGDPVPHVRIIQVLALFHDADKYVGDQRSRSPLLDQVEVVWNDLGGVLEVAPSLWPDWSVRSLQAAISLVENRGQSNALLGPPLPMAIQNLAYMVGQADNLMAKGADLHALESMDALVAAFNEKLPDWHALYGVPCVPLSWMRLHDSPIVLHQVISTIHELDLFFPLIMWRRGRDLLMTIPADWTTDRVLDQIIEGGFREPKTPRVKRNPTNGSVTLLDCEDVSDIERAVRESRIHLKDALTVKVADFARVEAYLAFWVAASPNSGYTLEELATTTPRKQFAPITWTSGDTSVYDQALMMGLVLGVLANKRSRLSRALELTGPGLAEPIKTVLSAIIEDFADLDEISVRTLVALQSALMVAPEHWLEYLAWVHGEFAPSASSRWTAGAEIIVDRLRNQCGRPLMESHASDSPYVLMDRGTCLLCGRPAGTLMKPSEMELVGVKRSAFNNRIGHQKSLWSQSEPNFLCDACLYEQRLLSAMIPQGLRPPSKVPLHIATPVHAIGRTPLKSEMVSSFDAMTVKEQKWHAVLPWKLDRHTTFPLGFEEKPDRDVAERDDVLGQIERLATYAALSGEPVHVFTGAQRALPTAFYYEGLPPWLAALLGGLERSGDVDGVSRKTLPQFLQRMKSLREIGHMPGGREVLIDIPAFGWWAVAWGVSREESTERTDRIQLLQQVKEWYRMDDYSALIQTAVDIEVEIRRHSITDSRNKLTVVFRRVIDEYQSMVGKAGVTFEFMENAMTGLVYQDLGRSEEYAVHEDKVKRLVLTCLAIVTQCDQAGQLNAKMVKYLLAAFEIQLREKIRERRPINGKIIR